MCIVVSFMWMKNYDKIHTAFYRVMMPKLYHGLEITSSMSLTLEVSWTVDTQKCVDASPSVVSWYEFIL